MLELRDRVKYILDNENIAYIATSNGIEVDNSVISFAVDEALNLFFVSLSSATKCKNIKVNRHVSVAVATLKIEGTVRKIERDSDEFRSKAKVYGDKFPLFARDFDQEDNELYIVEPSMIWHYDPDKGERYMDKLVLNRSKK